jgi:small-conductance mechanosensitive channel
MIARLIIARLILVCFGTAVFIMALRRLRTYRLKERHMLLFLFTGLPFLVLAIWPTGLGWVAQRLHIGYQTVSLLCVVAFLILMVFEFLTIVSLQERKIATLAQIVGIMMEKHGMSDRVLNEPSSASPRERES